MELQSNLIIEDGNPIITLDVSGIIIKTKRETLCKRSHYFNDMLSDPSVKIENSIFVDYDPIIFNHVLNFMRDPRYLYPKKYSFALDYFGVYVDISTIKNKEKTGKRCIGCICNVNDNKEMMKKYIKIIDTPCICKHKKQNVFGCSICDIEIEPTKCHKCQKQYKYQGELSNCCALYEYDPMQHIINKNFEMYKY